MFLRVGLCVVVSIGSSRDVASTQSPNTRPPNQGKATSNRHQYQKKFQIVLII
jgi:hypothetical protein